MDLFLSLLMRWMHILAAVVAVGGAIFMRFALLPSVSVLTDEQRQALHEQVRSRWGKLLRTAITMLIISGLANFFFHWQTMRDAGIKLEPLYHAVFGIKVLLALVVFFLASVLTGKSETFAGMRRNAKFWMAVNVVLAIVIICLSGVLRRTHIGPNNGPPPAASKSTSA